MTNVTARLHSPIATHWSQVYLVAVVVVMMVLLVRVIFVKVGSDSA